MKHIVCKKEDLEPGEIHVVYKGKVPIAVVRSESNEYYAVRGICPHQGALLTKGRMWPLMVSEEPGSYETARGSEILRCPWHSFDYDVTTGQCIGDSKLRVKTYPVYVENGDIIVDL